LILWPRRLLYLALALLLFGGATTAGLPPLPAAGTLLVLVALEGALRLLLRRQIPSFEKELMARLPRERTEDILAWFHRQTFLKFAAPHHYLFGKLGLIHRHGKNHRAAALVLKEAVEEAPREARAPLLLGLADSLNLIGEPLEAERAYRLALEETGGNGPASASLARLILKRGGDRAEAERHLRAALETAPTASLRCELIPLLLGRGLLEEADWQLQLASEELAKSTSEEDQERLRSAHAAVDAARASSAE